jgi:hypothetical protein
VNYYYNSFYNSPQNLPEWRGISYYQTHNMYRTVPYQQPKTDFGKEPFTLNISQASKNNNTYRTVIWTGEHLQVTLMSINVGDDIGLEIHPQTDQFFRIEQMFPKIAQLWFLLAHGIMLPILALSL